MLVYSTQPVGQMYRKLIFRFSNRQNSERGSQSEQNEKR